ncbi:uncharacterized protein DUF4019 [Luteibacter sp. OK325]|jgi:hypothetical protein|uniref:DUF4019 domain-containing protein n=1 Tax=Luteibacter sp. OK325 TaxID=2135670 RepID=UPI000D380F9F|nr:DUF4019 domain-containing protein [Luteibacter sp. OK325]PTR33661.1 uncharacterized protein DUF4019 [Luteibacter sp. OK325]
MAPASAVARKVPAPRLTGTNAFGAMLTVAHEPRLGPQPNSLDNAVANATHWVQLSNARRPDAMWLEAGAMMQRLVPRSDWVRYLRKIRLDRGALTGREWFEVTRVRDPVGLPAGDYLNVIFVAQFTRAVLFETVSLAPGSAGWMPVGYVIRPVQREISFVQ